jgi:hypothetical protein
MWHYGGNDILINNLKTWCAEEAKRRKDHTTMKNHLYDGIYNIRRTHKETSNQGTSQTLLQDKGKKSSRPPHPNDLGIITQQWEVITHV